MQVERDRDKYKHRQRDRTLTEHRAYIGSRNPRQIRGQGKERDVYEICRKRDRDKDKHRQRQNNDRNRKTQTEYTGSRNPRYTD